MTLLLKIEAWYHTLDRSVHVIHEDVCALFMHFVYPYSSTLQYYCTYSYSSIVLPACSSKYEYHTVPGISLALILGTMRWRATAREASQFLVASWLLLELRNSLKKGMGFVHVPRSLLFFLCEGRSSGSTRHLSIGTFALSLS